MASLSEFLTFYRRVATHPSLRTRVATPLSTRAFTISSFRASSGGKLSTDDSVKTDSYPDSEHATNKKDRLDVQSDNANKGQQAKQQGEGGAATSRSDSKNSTAKAKQEHPEAPDVVIGMQDERGGKGA